MDEPMSAKTSSGKFMEYACPICGAILVRLPGEYGYIFSCMTEDCEGEKQYLSEEYLEELSLKNCSHDAVIARAREEDAKTIAELREALEEASTIIDFYAIKSPISASDRPQRPCDIQAHIAISRYKILANGKDATHKISENEAMDDIVSRTET